MVTAKTNYRAGMRTRCKGSSSLLSTGQKEASDVIALRQMWIASRMQNHFKLTRKHLEKEDSQNH